MFWIGATDRNDVVCPYQVRIRNTETIDKSVTGPSRKQDFEAYCAQRRMIITLKIPFRSGQVLLYPNGRSHSLIGV